VSERNRRFVLRERPSGRIGPGTFELVDEPVPNIVEGEALVRTQWISLDPANRGWIRDVPSYVSCITQNQLRAEHASSAAQLGNAMPSAEYSCRPQVVTLQHAAIGAPVMCCHSRRSPRDRCHRSWMG
jgi:N-terminal domain of oxidoreductase